MLDPSGNSIHQQRQGSRYHSQRKAWRNRRSLFASGPERLAWCYVKLAYLKLKIRSCQAKSRIDEVK